MIKDVKTQNENKNNNLYRYNGEQREVIDLPGEEWKGITDFPLYQISNKGRIKKLTYSWFYNLGGVNDGVATEQFHQEQLMIPQKKNSGYLQINLRKDKKMHSFKVHRLVALAFVDGYEDGLVVNHIDENKLNNCADNLEWVTTKQNANHGTRNLRAGLTQKGKKKNIDPKLKKRLNEQLRLNSPFAKPMICNGKRYPSISAVARAYGISNTTVRKWAKLETNPMNLKLEYVS